MAVPAGWSMFSLLLLPFRIIFALLYFIAAALWVTLRLLLFPVRYPIRLSWSLVTLPFRVVPELWTLIIFFGVASLIGILMGVVVHFLYAEIAAVLLPDQHTDRESIDQQTHAEGRTAASYRAERRKKKSRVAQDAIKNEPTEDGPFGQSLDRLAQELLNQHVRGSLLGN